MNERALKAAFDCMEIMALQMVDARRSGDFGAFEAAAQEMRRAQAVFLRDLNRFPAETAQFLAHRQTDIVDAVAGDKFDLDLIPQSSALVTQGIAPQGPQGVED
ncbi:hypothetical protein [Arenibacterium sp. LLYu02]|uniref:hypothetical protein n=1 Tax=Arenibacterium sp. LLYu02 TaxID=3404132 RepID=UPI003B2267B7